MKISVGKVIFTNRQHLKDNRMLIAEEKNIRPPLNQHYLDTHSDSLLFVVQISSDRTFLFWCNNCKTTAGKMTLTYLASDTEWFTTKNLGR